MTGPSPGGEFEIIERYFAPLAGDAPLAYGLHNDAALLDLPPDRSLVVTVDAAVESVHYLPDDPPDLVARKLLRRNLSDLAAMGAVPRAYVLTLALTGQVEAGWLEAFAGGLAADQEIFGVTLIGGDITKTPGPPVMTLTALGEAPRGQALRRDGARADDVLFVSGTLGDAALGLLVLKGDLIGLEESAASALVQRYRLPEPRLELGQALLAEGLASAAIDISDGLIGDLEHIAAGSRLDAEVAIHALPLSGAVGAALRRDHGLETRILTGGDDYELLFAVPPSRAEEIAVLSRRLDLPLTRIGHMSPPSAGGPGQVRVLDSTGRPRALGPGGWRHF